MVRRSHPAVVLIALALLLGAAIAVTFSVLRPTPPRRVVMSTGPAGSANAEYADRYREILAVDGVDLVLEASAGELDNLARLNDPASNVSVAFVASGGVKAESSPGLVSLGTLFQEPIWGFYRATGEPPSREALSSKRWSAGAPGSLERAAMQRLVELLNLDIDLAKTLPLEPLRAADALRRGEIDAVLLVTSADTPLIRQLLATPGIDVLGFPRADAYVALFPFLERLTLPAGVGDLARNLPSHDVTLIAFQANLIIREDLHPAIQMLLLEAARRIHGGPGMFHQAGTYPAPDPVDLPISVSALQYYRSGPPFLQRYLPFWLAVFVAQLLVVAIPVVGVFYPALRLLPSAYEWTMRRRIFRLYGELKFLEEEITSAGDVTGSADVRARLDALEQRILALKVPTTYASLLYTLRQHLHLVRSRLDTLASN
jgi:TRAP-type uncharacterized transport system substrate-binding protein